MKPIGLYVCKASLEEKTICVEIIAKTPGTTCSINLTKSEAERIACDLMNQVIRISDEH